MPMTEQEKSAFLEKFNALDKRAQESCTKILNDLDTLQIVLIGKNISEVCDDNIAEIAQIIRNLPIGGDAGPIINNEPTGGDRSLIVNDPYALYLDQKERAYGRESRNRLQHDVDALADLTKRCSSGLVVGRVQSGKTATYIGLIAALQRDSTPWNVVISLTSNKINLGDQTYGRFKREFNSISMAFVSVDGLNAVDDNYLKNALLYGVY